MQAQRILIDLTDLEQWGGTHGGIQRVVYGIAKDFFLDKDSEFSLGFIRFSTEQNCFVETSFEPIYGRVDGVVLDSREPEIQPKTLRSTVSSMFRGKTQSSQVDAEVTLSKRDVVVMLGKPWDNLAIQAYLSEKKPQQHFRLIQVVYDMIISLHSHLQNPVLIESYNQHMRGVIESSDLLLCISRSTEQDLHTFAKKQKLKKPRTTVIRLGDEVSAGIKPNKKPDLKIARSFVLCVGTIEIRKNHALLYCTYKLAQERGIELPQLLIVGSRGWLTGDIQYLIDTDSSLGDKIKIIDNAGDDMLSWLYQNCLYSVYPSMYEGWGLPIAESLAYSKVCLSSNSSSMPEIAGNLIPYFSPYSPDELLSEMVKLSSKSVREKREKEIRRSYKSTSWNDCYKQVVKSLKESL